MQNMNIGKAVRALVLGAAVSLYSNSPALQAGTINTSAPLTPQKLGRQGFLKYNSQRIQQECAVVKKVMVILQNKMQALKANLEKSGKDLETKAKEMQKRLAALKGTGNDQEIQKQQQSLQREFAKIQMKTQVVESMVREVMKTFQERLLKELNAVAQPLIQQYKVSELRDEASDSAIVDVDVLDVTGELVEGLNKRFSEPGQDFANSLDPKNIDDFLEKAEAMQGGAGAPVQAGVAAK